MIAYGSKIIFGWISKHEHLNIFQSGPGAYDSGIEVQTIQNLTFFFIFAKDNYSIQNLNPHFLPSNYSS